MRRRIHATVHGFVQGVSFRYYTVREAQRLSLSGWVANRPDGTVELIAEGSEDALAEMLQFLHRGSPHAVVEGVDSEWLEATNEFPGFMVRR